VAVLGAVGMVTTWKAPAAFACDDGANNHCYAIANNHSLETGVYGQLYITCMYAPNNVNAGYFATNEVWNGSTDGLYFTEGGVFSGAANGNYYSKSWFWADQRPNGGGYHEHPGGGTPNTGTRYPVEIVWAGNNTWNIYGGNSDTLIGQSTSQPLTVTNDMDAGTEYTVPSGKGMRNVGSINELQYLATSGTWTFWGTRGGADPELGPGAYITPGYSSSNNFVTWTGPC